MVAQQQIISFPHYEDALKELVEQHKLLEEWPLILAVYYAPDRQQQDVFLFEVVQKFGEGELNPDKTLFEVIYGSTPGFPMDRDQHLHLLMANSRELEVALSENWPNATEIRQAMHEGRGIILFADTSQAQRLIELING